MASVARKAGKKAAAAAAPVGKMRIEYEELGALRRFPGNPKLHDLDELGASFDEQGYIDPIVIDERTGLMAAGHGRLEKLEMMRDAGSPPPERIVVKGRKWYVPVLRGVAFKSDEALRKYVVAANRIPELGGWDNQALAKILTSLGGDLLATGFDEGDFAAFITGAGVDDPNAHWRGMPAFEHEEQGSWKSVRVHFKDKKDYQAFCKRIGQRLTDETRSIWFPPAEIGVTADKHYGDAKG